MRVPPADTAIAVADTIACAETYGWDTVWLGDSQLLWRDPFTVLAVAALRTQRIRLGIAVTNLRTRHVSVLASAIRTVAELAPGRLVVAVGAGHSSVRSIGAGPTSTRDLALGVHRLLTLLAGETVDFGARPAVPLRDPAAKIRGRRTSRQADPHLRGARSDEGADYRREERRDGEDDDVACHAAATLVAPFPPSLLLVLAIERGGGMAMLSIMK